MQQLFKSILVADPAALTAFADLLKVVRKTLPNIRRDECLIGLANAGYSLSMITDVPHVSGVRLA